MGVSSLAYLLFIWANFALGLRRDPSQKNLTIKTQNNTLNIKGNIKTISDIKRCLSNEHGFVDHVLRSGSRLLRDDELYSEDEHKDLNMSLQIRGGMNIRVETMHGRKIQLQVSQNETVLDLKKKLEQEQTIPVDQQRLIFNGKLLENGKTIAEYGIKEDAVLHLVLRLRGG